MAYFKKYLKKETMLFIGVSLIILIGVKCLIFNQETKATTFVEDDVTVSSQSDLKETEEEKNDGKMYVDIKGAVRMPGMYEVSSDMRVLNVIDMAGGLKEKADDKQINFSQKLEDQMIIYIPLEGEEIPEAINNQNTSKESLGGKGSEEAGKVNLNQAEKDELMTLNGVGEKKAEKIIEYREENGSFKSIDDLKNVNGIGEKTFESLKESITI
ncbi:helix-hairpin-helix domain-containing protein [Vagococcus carniphilus]|uniref:Helix-hairpin-helix DNA-binding motif class 1 domain-containing protein n=1 Tax=Vagococcus carniphilus TaxID=218144 RepID=A0A430B7T7_9ENTE|nr:helix-hairpin-helix domain-containing protein [Vagococcus carniphilus]QNN74292.1 helix-hairpin-helix domain-containing protein [Vagococcus carniphilus]RSU16404.1 hypothetical protein CBF28_02435 [Vagococcus carniphilus]